MTSTLTPPVETSRTVISDPGREIMGGGKNAKWVKSGCMCVCVCVCVVVGCA